jgi:hypothetical protein
MAIVAMKDFTLIGPEGVTRTYLVEIQYEANGGLSAPANRFPGVIFSRGRKCLTVVKRLLFMSRRVLLHGAGLSPAVLPSCCNFVQACS